MGFYNKVLCEVFYSRIREGGITIRATIRFVGYSILRYSLVSLIRLEQGTVLDSSFWPFI